MKDGRPTFKPSALWYLDQFDVRNAIDFEIISRKVLANVRSKVGHAGAPGLSIEEEDLLLQVRAKGTFTEEFEVSRRLPMLMNRPAHSTHPHSFASSLLVLESCANSFTTFLSTRKVSR
jgi:hypothetical protein